MVKHNGLCPSLKKKVDFDVSEIVEIPTKRGVKYQVKGTYDGRTCSTFCSKAKAEELKARLGGRTMAAEEDTTGQAHQEEGVSPLRGQVEPLAQGQTSAEALPVQQTVSKPIVGTDVGVEPLQPIEAPNIPESSMETVFDEAPEMDANFEIAEMQPDGDGRSIGNIAPMNPDAPLHAEEFSADEAEIAEDSEMNVGQVQQTADEPAIIGPSELAYGQEQESAEALPVQQTVATSFSPADSQIAPIDDLSLPDMDVLERMQVEFGEAPEMLANFTISAPQIFGDGQSIGNIAPMNPDVPFASEDDDDDDEVDMNKIANPMKFFMKKYDMTEEELEEYFEKMDNESDDDDDEDDDFDAETFDPLDETTLEVPPAVVFVEKIPPTVWSNLTPESQMVYAETGDESVLICPQCGISKAQLRNQDGYCAVSDPEGMAYNASLDCPYQKHFAPAHWVDDEFVVGHVEGDFVEVATRLPADVDMPPMKGADTGVLTKMVPFYVWNRINQLVPAGITATPDATGLNYTLQYYGANQPLVENRIDVSEGDTDFMFGSERYHATILEAESGGYYINPQSLRIYGADNAEEDKGIYGDMFDYPIVYADLSADGRGYLIGYDDGGIWHTGILFGGIEGNQEFIKEVAQKRLETHEFYQNRKKEETRPQTETTSDDDPDFDPEKADRNKDGEISDWERAVGNAVAKGIREHRESKGHMNFAETFEADKYDVCLVCYDRPATTGSYERVVCDECATYRTGMGQVEDYTRVDCGSCGAGDILAIEMMRCRNCYDSMCSECPGDSAYCISCYEEHGAETFDVEFDDWAEQEMLTHGRNVSFKDWAKREGKTHGNMELTDWAEHEEESHDERYGAEEGAFYQLEVKYNMADGWEHYGDYDDKQDAINAYYDIYLEHPEVKLLEVDSEGEDEVIYVQRNFDLDAETFESPTTQDKIKPRTIATLLGAGALATILAPETIKKLFNRK